LFYFSHYFLSFLYFHVLFFLLINGDIYKGKLISTLTMTKKDIQFGTGTGKALTNDVGSTTFPCPNCGKSTINRTKQERELGVKYVCVECGFQGPN
jgi:predicted RNA-binding Zn-ribbon protein involved in translation (DUF1610 family)